MSTYYTYYFRAPLSDKFTGDLEDIKKMALDNDVYFDVESSSMPCSENAPSFGEGTIYEGPKYDFWGLKIENGELLIGVFAENLDRGDEVEVRSDYAESVAVPTRLDKIMRFLSQITIGEIGEIQGAFSSERFDFEAHADPIIRCADGQVRVAETPVTPYIDDIAYWVSDGTEKVAIPNVLPRDFVSNGYHSSRIKLDIDRLTEWCKAVSMTSAPRV